jgi:S-formylglutathione hydrolase
MKKIESHQCHGGELQVWEHVSTSLSCDMRFSIFLPPQVANGARSAVTFLSGLTCTHDTFTTKAGAYGVAAELGLIIIAPDTSPRGDDVPDDESSYDFGKGAGFYINATQDPWAKNFKMETYIVEELRSLITDNFPVDVERQAIMGHSMGGHGALTLFFKYPDLYQSVSAFSPIVAPSQLPWGQKAFKGYLGDDEMEWREHDACELVANSQKKNVEILIDQGLGDNFLEEQLKPELFKNACAQVEQKLNLRLQDGYNHSYFFIQSFIGDHLRHHAQNILK